MKGEWDGMLHEGILKVLNRASEDFPLPPGDSGRPRSVSFVGKSRVWGRFRTGLGYPEALAERTTERSHQFTKVPAIRDIGVEKAKSGFAAKSVGIAVSSAESVTNPAQVLPITLHFPLTARRAATCALSRGRCRWILVDVR